MSDLSGAPTKSQISWGALSLYIHLPFCRVKCPYCDFVAYARLEGLIPTYGDALLKEMELWAPLARAMKVSTIYFGGGTPSLLPLAELERLLAGAARHFRLAPSPEISLEANPGTVDYPYLRGLRALGVNRLSLGVQSFADAELRFLGRDHSAAEARRACGEARRAGFANVSLDLIYGLPGQGLRRWQANLEQALALAPEHLSLYPLTIEDRTPLRRWIERGQVPAPDPDRAAAMYEGAEERLAGAGYAHYEIANWARPGFQCRHNLTYWENRPYLGLGAGAHSFLVGFRCANVASPRQYIQRLGAADPSRPLIGDGPPKGGPHVPTCRDVGCSGPLSEVIAIDGPREMAETAILGLRLGQGLDGAAFRHRFGLPPQEVWGPQMAELMALGLLEAIDGHWRLTAKGRLLANEVFLRFLPQAAKAAP